MNPKFSKLLCLPALLCSVGLACGAEHYTVTDLGALGDYSYANDINNRDQIVGRTGFPGAGEGHGFLWRDGKMSDLGTLGGDYSDASAINDFGQIVGQSDLAGGSSEAFSYLAGGQMAALPTLGGANGSGLGINNSGQIVGRSNLAGSSQQNAFLYANGQTAGLGTLGGTSSEAKAINASGQIVGRSLIPAAKGGSYHAFLYENGTMKDLEILDGATSDAHSINNAGQIVGISDFGGPFSATRAFLYANGKMTSLGHLGGSYSEAWDINAQGQIVGSSRLAGGADRAFLYRGGAMVDLNALIRPDSGWVLTRAAAINDSGRIVGGGLIHGVLHAFLLTPVPAPQLKIAGKMKLTTTKARFVLKGRATGSVEKVTVKIGKKTKAAKGTANWSLKLALKPGKNKVTVTAVGPGGISAPARLTVTRK